MLQGFRSLALELEDLFWRCRPVFDSRVVAYQRLFKSVALVHLSVFREIKSSEDRPRAQPGFVKPIRNGLSKEQSLI